MKNLAVISVVVVLRSYFLNFQYILENEHHALL